MHLHGFDLADLYDTSLSMWLYGARKWRGWRSEQLCNRSLARDMPRRSLEEILGTIYRCVPQLQRATNSEYYSESCEAM